VCDQEILAIATQHHGLLEVARPKIAKLSLIECVS